ncbi:hypothetical protein [Salinimicrobium oceani]|uniref:DUF2383 domain-containing protein n=1 Tax=Salinimicrobium oceani TaxID=2722702 RepID=A0ABX1D4T2_9FLAO|nr:hypothetical protein [Salinimicrobium oceani]NJW53738.1 hypothetical protein [Salinimicrobium oceani]
MNNSKIREATLRRLLEENFLMSKFCRSAAEALTDPSLKYYFQNNASRRSQFAIELAGEISFYSGKEPHTPLQAYDRSRKGEKSGEPEHFIKKSIKRTKKNLESYQEALCKICEGSCREILLRHKAYIENSLFELKSIKTLMKFQRQDHRFMKEEQSRIA